MEDGKEGVTGAGGRIVALWVVGSEDTLKVLQHGQGQTCGEAYG